MFIAEITYDVFTHPCPNFNSSLAKPPLKLWHGWVITSHMTDVITGMITYPFHNFNGGLTAIY